MQKQILYLSILSLLSMLFLLHSQSLLYNVIWLSGMTNINTVFAARDYHINQFIYKPIVDLVPQPIINIFEQIKGYFKATPLIYEMY